MSIKRPKHEAPKTTFPGTLAISENALLTQLSLDKLNSSDGKIVVVRNPLLNMSKLCDRMDKISNGYRMIAGNKADCGESSTG